MENEAFWFNVYDSEADEWLQMDERSWGSYSGAAEFTELRTARDIAKREASRSTERSNVVVMGDFGSWAVAHQYRARPRMPAPQGCAGSYDDVAKAVQDLGRSAISHFTAIAALLSANPEHPALREALQAAIDTSGEARSTFDFAEQALANYRLRLEASSGMSFTNRYEPPPAVETGADAHQLLREGIEAYDADDFPPRGWIGRARAALKSSAPLCDCDAECVGPDADKPEKGDATTKTD